MRERVLVLLVCVLTVEGLAQQSGGLNPETLDCPGDDDVLVSFLELVSTLGGEDQAQRMINHMEAVDPRSILTADPATLAAARNLMHAVPSFAQPTSIMATAAPRNAVVIPNTLMAIPVPSLSSLTSPPKIPNPMEMRDKIMEKKERFEALSGKYREVGLVGISFGMFVVVAKGMSDWMKCHDLWDEIHVLNESDKLRIQLDSLQKYDEVKKEKTRKKLKPWVPGATCDRPKERKPYRPSLDWDLTQWIRDHMAGVDTSDRDKQLKEVVKSQAEEMRDMVMGSMSEVFSLMSTGESGAKSPVEVCDGMKISFSPGWAIMDVFHDLIAVPGKDVKSDLMEIIKKSEMAVEAEAKAELESKLAAKTKTTKVQGPEGDPNAKKLAELKMRVTKLGIGDDDEIRDHNDMITRMTQGRDSDLDVPVKEIIEE